MIAGLPPQPSTLAIVAFVAGIAMCWMTETPFGLLAPVSALFLYARGRAVPLLNAALGIALAGSVLAGPLYTEGMRDLSESWSAFFALALCIGAIVATSVSATTPSHVIRLFLGVVGATLEDRSAATACKLSVAESRSSARAEA